MTGRVQPPVHLCGEAVKVEQPNNGYTIRCGLREDHPPADHTSVVHLYVPGGDFLLAHDVSWPVTAPARTPSSEGTT